MQDYRSTSGLPDVIDQMQSELSSPSGYNTFAQGPQDFQLNYQNVLQSVVLALSHLQPFTIGRTEHGLIEQFRDYVQRLLAIQPAQSAEEQFSHLYALRKWLFWVPATILRDTPHDYLTLVFLAHLYAMALAVEPLFPDVAGPLISAMSLAPLESLLSTVDELRQNPLNSNLSELDANNILSIATWPQQIAQAYRTRRYQTRYGTPALHGSPTGFDDFSFDLDQAGQTFRLPQPSPAFAPQQESRKSISSNWSSGGGSSGSPFYDLPMLASNSPTTNRSYPAPSLPGMSAGYDPNESLFTESQLDYTTGFVYSPPPLWT